MMGECNTPRAKRNFWRDWFGGEYLILSAGELKTLFAKHKGHELVRRSRRRR
jgi:hypothetical protein